MNESDLTWEPTTSYGDFFRGMVEFFSFMVREPSQLTLDSYWTLFRENSIGLRGIALLCSLAVVWTMARQFLTKRLLQPFGRHCRLTVSSQSKMPESFWKFFFYLFAFSWTFYITILKYRYFQKPSTTFSSWDPKVDLTWDMNVLYAVQFSFYMHSLYTIFFMDLWKKDSVLLVVHHVLTILLFSCAYIGRFSEGGSLTILCHDCCDVLLELAKIMSYFKIQDRKEIRVFEHLATFFFGSFAVTWFVCRLYLFPLRVIHTLTFNIKSGFLARMHLMYISYVMVLFLLAMNIYWAVLIVDLIMRVSSGRMSKLDDPRDYDVQTNESSGTRTKTGRAVDSKKD